MKAIPGPSLRQAISSKARENYEHDPELMCCNKHLLEAWRRTAERPFRRRFLLRLRHRSWTIRGGVPLIEEIFCVSFFLPPTISPSRLCACAGHRVFRARRAEDAGLVRRLRLPRHHGLLYQQMGIPAPLAFLAIALILRRPGIDLRLAHRIAAFGIIVNMLVAIITVHHVNGLFMNCSAIRRRRLRVPLAGDCAGTGTADQGRGCIIAGPAAGGSEK